MSDEQNNESKNLKKKKIEVYEKNADGWLKDYLNSTSDTKARMPLGVMPVKNTLGD